MKSGGKFCWFTEFCKNIYNEEISIVDHSQNPDILFCSIFGWPTFEEIKNIQAKKKIFFSGENLNGRPYLDKDKMKDTFDIILGFDKTDLKYNIVRLPLWIIYYKYFTMNSNDNLMNYLINERKKNIKNKKFFGTLVASHDSNGIRKIIYDALSKFGDVLSGGKFNNNITMPNNNKKDFIK